MLGKLSPKPRSSSSSGGEALVIPGWVSCSRGRDSGRDSSPSRPEFWLFCLSSAVAPLSSCLQDTNRRFAQSLLLFQHKMKQVQHTRKKTKTYNRNLDNFAGVAMALDACSTTKQTVFKQRCRKQPERCTNHDNSQGISHKRFLKYQAASPTRMKMATEMQTGRTGDTNKQTASACRNVTHPNLSCLC